MYNPKSKIRSHRVKVNQCKPTMFMWQRIQFKIHITTQHSEDTFISKCVTNRDLSLASHGKNVLWKALLLNITWKNYWKICNIGLCCVNTHIQSLKVWLKSALPLMNTEFSLGNGLFFVTPCLLLCVSRPDDCWRRWAFVQHDKSGWNKDRHILHRTAYTLSTDNFAAAEFNFRIQKQTGRLGNCTLLSGLAEQ